MAARGGPGPGSRHRALRGLLLLCLWLPSGRPGEPAAPPSGVDRLLQDFRRQLQRARPREELEPELLGGPREDCPGAGGTAVYRAVPDAVIRTQDSIAAGASFLRAPGTCGAGGSAWRPAAPSPAARLRWCSCPGGPACPRPRLRPAATCSTARRAAAASASSRPSAGTALTLSVAPETPPGSRPGQVSA